MQEKWDRENICFTKIDEWNKSRQIDWGIFGLLLIYST